MLERFSAVVFCVFVFSGWVIPLSVPTVALPPLSYGTVDQEFESGSMLFVGDIMLGRHVETLAREHGAYYPFENIRNLISSADVAVGNFEGVVPPQHRQTPDFEMRFSVDESFFPILADIGFDALSLANNHSYDFKKTGYDHTLARCMVHGLFCGGHPYALASSSYRVVLVGDTKVGVLFLHSTSPEAQVPLKALGALLEDTELQVAFIHWGEEYRTLHSSEQEELAMQLIDRGFDAVIGHHPHVVQDIGEYKGKPIFYSLGNFIFDQYFSDAVLSGLALRLDIEKDRVGYTLIPITSKSSPSQPRIMTVDEKHAFFETLSLGDRLALSAPHFISPR